MPAKNKTALTETQKQTIVALRMQGLSNRTIGEKLGLHHITVSKVYGEFRREAAQIIDDLGDDWKRDMKILAVRAVKRGLTDESDNFKSGAIGLQALKGLGEFADGQQLKVGGAVNLVVRWGSAQRPATHDQPIDTESKLIGD